MTTNRIWAIGYTIVVIGLVALFLLDAQQDRELRTTRADAKASTIRCIKNIIDVSNDSTTARAKAAQTRDDALVGSKKALRELIRLRVIEQQADGEQVRQAAQQYLVQTQKFIEASAALDKARKDNPVPNIEELCK